jgi:hypothetical protein
VFFFTAMIKIDFQFETPHGKFADALHLPDDHAFTEEEIQAMKEQRRDNWIAAVTAPPVPDPDPEYVEINGVRYVRA